MEGKKPSNTRGALFISRDHARVLTCRCIFDFTAVEKFLKINANQEKLTILQLKESLKTCIIKPIKVTFAKLVEVAVFKKEK